MSEIIYEAKGFPVLQNVLYNTKEEALNCKVGDIELVQNEETGIIHNRLFDESLIDYNADYSFDPSVSQAYRKLAVGIKDIIEKYLGKEKLLEIGCGKGFFVEFLSSFGFDILGMDPAYEGSNPNIKKEYYSKETNKEFNGIIMRHVLEHIKEPYDFLCSIKDANNNKGLVYIEVPCFDYINEKSAFMDIYYEHVNYFRKKDFENMFSSIIDSGHIFGGQYLYIVADLATLKRPVKTDVYILNNSFFAKLEDYVHLIKNSQKNTAIWGCGPRAQILAFWLQKYNTCIDYFVDINPVRNGKYLALVNHYENQSGGVISDITQLLDEVKKDEAIVFVMNKNYLEEIKEMSKNRYEYITLD